MPRNGRLVVVIVLAIGLSLGAVGSWWLVRSRPTPGEFIDVLALPNGSAVVIRHERGTDHTFVEVRGPDRLLWRGLVPRYAGSPGTLATAATATVLTVRVTRSGHPVVFAFHTATGRKLASFGLADDLPPDPHGYTLPGIATVPAGERSVEVLGRPGGGARLILVELSARRLAWRVDLPAPPDEVWVEADAVLARRGTEVSAWSIVDGAPRAAGGALPPTSAVGGGRFFTDLGWGTGGGGAIRYPVPAAAVRPRRYHQGGDRIWIVEPTRLTVLDGDLAPIATIAE